MFDVMFQKFYSYFFKNEICIWRYYVSFFRKKIDELANHDFMIRHYDKWWWKEIFRSINHFNNIHWFSIFWIDWIELINVFRYHNFLFFKTFDSKFIFIEVDNVVLFSNIQFFQLDSIISKSFKHICFLNDFKSNHRQRFDFAFMQIVLFSSISESSFEEINRRFILKLFQIYNRTKNKLINRQNFMHQQRTYEVIKSLFFIINHDFIMTFSGLAIRITINKWSQRSTFNVEYSDHRDCFFDRILNQKFLRIFNDCVYCSTMLIHDFKKKSAEKMESSSIKWMKKSQVRNSKCNTDYK